MSNQTTAPNVASNQSTMSSSWLFALILSCFFISGFTGLIYEIIWTRMIVKIIGSAPFAVSIVLTVFMGGLGFGSYIAGRTVDRIKEPMKLVKIYGALELGIGAYGLILPALLILFRPLYAVVYNNMFEYFLAYNLMTFFGCALLLIIPVTFMGATLPVLSRFIVTSLSHVGTDVGRLYGLNTIGAAAGSLVCGFWLVNFFGVWGALTIAIILNACIGFLCLYVGARWVYPQIPSPSSGRPEVAVAATAEVSVESQSSPVWHALMIFAVSGFCAMAYEVVWVKLLGLLVGPTTYSFTVVLVTFITGLALGSMFFGWLADRVASTSALLFVTQIIAGISALLVSQILGNGQVFFAKLIFVNQESFTQLMLVQSAILFLFMFLPTFCLGATFPLVGKIYTRSLDKTGRSIGYAYAINTVGAVLGSFCAGFLLIPFLGKEQSIRFIVSIQILTTLIVWWLLLFRTQKRKLVLLAPSAALIVAIMLMAHFRFPQWNRLMLSKGKYHRFEQLNKKQLEEMGWIASLLSGTDRFAEKENQDLVYYGDGIGGFTAVLKTPADVLGNEHFSMLNSGKADASSQKGDMCTQTLLAHFPLMFHEHPENVLVLGLASGITSGETLYYPLKKLDTIEINRQVIEASDYFRPWNNDVLTDEKTELIVQDGRAHLTLTDRRYDVIISEPSNPWMAGLAALFTSEFMNLAKDKLTDRGIFVQWIHSYQMNWETFALVGRTFADVFPNGILVSTNPNNVLYGPDFLLVGFKNDRHLDPSIAAANLQYIRRSTNIDLQDSFLLYNFIVNEDLPVLFGEGALNTDANPVLEFSAPKLMHFTQSAEEIGGQILAGARFKPETMEILKINRSDADRQIAQEALRFSFDRPSKNILDLTRLNPAQKDRYTRIVREYCADNPVHDYHFITDPALKLQAIRANLQRVAEYQATSEKPFPLEYYQGWVYSKNGFPLEATDHLLDVLATEPHHVQANEALAKILVKQQNLQPFLFVALKKMQAVPDNAALAYYVGQLYQQTGNIVAAASYYIKSTSLDPNFSLPLKRLAALSVMQKNYPMAVSYYKRMVNLKPDSAVLHYNLACLYALQDMPKESIASLENAVAKGYDRWDLLKTDKDLESIRGTAAYKALINKHSKNEG